MTSPQELHIRFRHLDVDYDINLVKDKKSDYSVQMNGTSYAVLGDEGVLKRACEILDSVSLESISNSVDLQGRLSLLEDISFPQTQKVESLGIKTLGTQQEFRTWKKSEEENLPKIRQF